MPDIGQAQVNRDMLARALEGLEELATGRFAERMRRDAAARVLMTVKRVQRLRAAGLLDPAKPSARQRRAVAEVERIGAGWLSGSTTAAEYVSDLSPADLQALTELAPLWADAAADGSRRR